MSVVLSNATETACLSSASGKWLTWQSTTPSHIPYVDLQFDDSTTDPTVKNYGRRDGWWEQLSTEPNTWRYYNASADWVELFCGDGDFPDYAGGPYTTIRETFDCVGYGYTDEVIMMPGLFRNTAIRNCVTIDTSNCIDLASMFSTSGIVAIPSLNTSKCKDFNGFATDCVNLVSVGNIDTSKGECMCYMFKGCPLLTTVPPISLESANDTYTSPHNVAGPGCRMLFRGDSSLDTLTIYGGARLGHWQEMFYHAPLTNLNAILDFSSCWNARDMFNGCDLRTFPTITNVCPRANLTFPKTLYGEIYGMPTYQQMFLQNLNCGAGAYALYQEFVSKGYTTDTIGTHGNSNCGYMFYDCGIDTVDGHADLELIPYEWGGLYRN